MQTWYDTISFENMREIFTAQTGTGSASTMPLLCGGLLHLREDTQLRERFHIHDMDNAVPVFLGSAYRNMPDLSPFLFTSIDPFHAFYSELWKWPGNWGFLFRGAGGQSLHHAHWRSLLSAVMPDGTISHFRYYSSTVLARVIPALDRQELAWLLGPAAELFIPLTQGDWLHVCRPNLESISADEAARRWKEPAKPWWQVTEAQLAAFADTLGRVYLDNIEQRIWDESFLLAAEVEEQYGSVRNFVESALDNAAGIGFTDSRHVFRYLMCCLHFDCNYRPSEDVKWALKDAAHSPEAALDRLEHVLGRPRYDG